MTLAEVEAHNKRVAEGKKKTTLDTAGMITRVPKVEQGLTPDQLLQVFKKQRGGMNHTESRFKKVLESRFPKAIILFEHFTLKLGNQCRYNPDFFVYQEGQPLQFWEVKGKHVWDDSLVKIKSAANKYFWFQFFIAQWKDGHWTEKQIMPE